MKLFNGLIVIAVLACAVYLVVVLGRPVFMYRAFKADVRDMAKMTIITDRYEFKEEVIKKAREYGLSLKPEHVRVSGGPGRYRVKVAWTEFVYVFTKEYEFAFEVPE